MLLSTDPTLTVDNITGAMEIVTVDKRRRVWESWRVLDWSAVEEIYSSHSSEEERLQYCAETYSARPDSSWEELVLQLYFCDEMAAAKKAKAFLQQKGE